VLDQSSAAEAKNVLLLKTKFLLTSALSVIEEKEIYCKFYQHIILKD